MTTPPPAPADTTTSDDLARELEAELVLLRAAVDCAVTRLLWPTWPNLVPERDEEGRPWPRS